MIPDEFLDADVIFDVLQGEGDAMIGPSKDFCFGFGGGG